MLARVTTFTIDGLEPRRVWVEADIRSGLPSFAIVGLADTAVREARERVRAAILNSGLEFPQRRITVNLAPANMRKAGPGFDLAVAVAVLAASGQVPAEALAGTAVFGELSLGGEVRPCRGALAVAEGARRTGTARLLVACEVSAEAALVDGLAVAAVATLCEAADVLAGRCAPRGPVAAVGDHAGAGGSESAPIDLADVRGQRAAVRALEIAAAGGHNLLMEGVPGSGKTMLARRLPTILPPLTRAEALEVTRIHSVAGIHTAGGLVRSRPFRAPHHSTSASGLVGGGPVPSPGEATLAHRGVLFLDELAEFSRPSLEALRQPLEDGWVGIVRGQHAVTFPTRFMLVAATNPCPCGQAGDGSRTCRCTDTEVERYRRRLSGPLVDRMDLLVAVERPAVEDLAAPAVTDSAAAAARVADARERQLRRLAAHGAHCNAQLDARLLRRIAALDADAERALEQAYRRGAMSARGHERVRRVARTIADLAGSERVTREHVVGALGLRPDSIAWAPLETGAVA